MTKSWIFTLQCVTYVILTERRYEQVDNNEFCICSVFSSLQFVKYNNNEPLL